MLDRRDLRYWGKDAVKTWLGTLIGALGLWIACLVLASESYYDFLLSPAAASLFLVLMTGLVTIITVVIGNRTGLPLVLSFGTTRRSVWLATRITQFLPYAATLIVVLALRLFTKQAISVASACILSAVLLALTALGDLLGVMSTRGGVWFAVSGIFVGLMGGCFGGFVSFNLTAGPEEALTSLVDLRWGTAAAVVIAVSLAITVVGNLGSAICIRRAQVQF